VPVDNTIYDRLGERWWDEDGFLYLLRSGLNPARVGYIRRVLVQELGRTPAGLRVLDIGCGGGLLAEEIAGLGCAVTGVDPSEVSLRTAREHARAAGLQIRYLAGRAEALPLEDGAFDAVCCCDVLEHVDDVGATVAEIARVLAPGGAFLYDTINRTWRSRLTLITLAQDCPLTRWAEPDLHDWRRFIRPAELERELVRAGLRPGDQTGLAPANPARALKATIDRARGRIGYAEMGRRLELRESRDRSAVYAGYALREARTAAASPSTPTSP
jgi:2-polyprenyl-6-hydroxyphenyl methylase/3-demethylubiquinone-9 3-methyltransferase